MTVNALILSGFVDIDTQRECTKVVRALKKIKRLITILLIRLF